MKSSTTNRTLRLWIIACCLSLSSSIQAQTFVKVLQQPFTSDTGTSRGAAFVDFDNDGDDDLYISNVGNNFLYRNNGDGTFSKIASSPLLNTGSLSIGMSWADIDNDGDLDLAMAGVPTFIYRNEGGDQFTKFGFGTPAINGWSCAWGDYDNDGFVDLVVARPNGYVPGLASNALIRFLADLETEVITDSPVVTGLATYTTPSWSDPDNDGDLDLYIAAGPAVLGPPAPDFLYRNLLTESGTAAFERIQDAPLATDAHDGQLFNWFDYDNDRDLDVLVTNWGQSTGGLANNLYRNDGDHFTKITSGAIVTDADISLASLVGDYDNDGDLDVLVPNDQTPNRYYQNNGDGTFTRMQNAMTAEPFRTTWAGSVSDYDKDGDLDVFLCSGGDGSNQPNALYRNDLSNGNHWIGMKLAGTVSNRAAIGAKVSVLATIQGEPVWQLREISSQDSFNGQNSLNVHFGLGNADSIQEIEVRWPSGIVQTLQDVAADQFLSIQESATTDADGDGVDDEIEDQAPNQGDGNGDAIPDRDQPHVASLPSADGTRFLTLAAQPGVVIANLLVSSDPPSPEDPPASSLWFPLGFLSFDLTELSQADQTAELFLHGSPSPDTFQQYGPTPFDENPHWYEFLFAGMTGAELEPDRVAIHYVDGGRGDNDRASNGQISVTGAGTVVQLNPLYLARLGDGTFENIGFSTSILLTNPSDQATLARVQFFRQGDGAPMQIDLGEAGSGSSIDVPLAAGATSILETTGSGALQTGYARVYSGQGVDGLAVFTRSDLQAGIGLTEAGVLTATPLSEFAIILDSIGARDTGLAIVYPPREGGGPMANVTLRLYSQPGALVAEETLDPLPPGANLARFISEFFADQPAIAQMASEMRGRVTVQSSQPLVAVALRQTDDPGIDFPGEVPILTTLPVIPRSDN